MQDDLRLNIVENTVSVPVELSQSPVAFPEPTLFNWSKNGQAFNDPSLTYSSVTFTPLRRSDTGNYMVSATNYILGSSTEQVGNDTGSFFLNVICTLGDFVVAYDYTDSVYIQMGHPSKSLGLLSSMHYWTIAFSPSSVAQVWIATLKQPSPGQPLMPQL